MSQMLSDQQIQQFSNYQHEIPLDTATVFYLLLSGIDAHQTEFSAADYVVLQDERRTLLSKENQQRQALFKQAARNLVAGKAVEEINAREFAQGMVSVYLQLETAQSQQYKDSLQRTLQQLSVSGQTLLQQKIIPPNMAQGSHTQTHWQQMADEEPTLVVALFAETLSQIANQSQSE